MLIGIDGNEANVEKRVGSNMYAFELIKHLQKLDSVNEYFIYLREIRRQDLPKESKKFLYKVIPPKKLWTQWRLPLELYLGKPRPDVFLSPGHYGPRFSPLPTVISILDLSFLIYPESFKPGVLKQLTSWTERSARQASHILTISEATKKDIERYYQIPSEKITVTYPGVNMRFQRDLPAEASAQAGISDGEIQRVKDKYGIKEKYFLFVGTRQPKKNLPRLIKAFLSLKRNDVSLVIAGKEWEQFQPSAVAYEQSDKIVDVGFVSNEDLPVLMKGAEALVEPSLYEGFGLPVAEAMTLGTPVVIANVSSLPEITGTAGIVVDPLKTSSITAGLQEVLDLPQEKKVQLETQLKAQAKQFSWEKCARKTLQVLYEVANQRQNG